VIVGGVVFVALLATACVTDVRSRRIPNRLVLALLACGLVFAIVVQPTLLAPIRATGSFLLGLAIWMPFYLFRMLGAGDVKLFAAASTWLAPGAVLEAALISALVGGVLGLVWFVRTHGLGFTVVRLAHATREPRVLREATPVESRARRLPYGVAMSLGLLATVLHVYAPSFL
jgi:prepilin peptidase CpaA